MKDVLDSLTFYQKTLIIMKTRKINKQFLYKEYIINKKFCKKIAQELNCSGSFIYVNLIKHNIPPRNHSEAQVKWDKILTKKFLIKEYITNKKSMTTIAKEVGCSSSTVFKYIKSNKILTRTLVEAGKNKLKGKGHHCYKDGRSLKDYYCIDCLKKGIETKISVKSGVYGNGRCNSCADKIKWQDKEFREKTLKAIFKGRSIIPNKPEKILIKLLNKILPKTYKFVGDGKLIVGGFCPDFVNKDNNKIIEMYGTYWHTIKGAKEKDKHRLKIYKKAGYKTLIIWQHELKYLDKVKDKILKFDKKDKNGTKS